MKLHLPVSLFKCLMSLMPVVAVVTSMPVSASVQHQDASVVTYTDFGQNAGRYSVGVTNALLQYVNRNGVVLTYTGGQADYVLPHGMIDFSAGYYRSTAAAISANCVATVKHNGAISADFTQQYYGIGTENAIRYQAIEYKGDATFSQVVDPSHPSAAASYQTDHKVTRLSKIITDVDPAEIYDNSKTTNGMLGYHAGSGRFTLSDYGGNLNQLAGSYSYVTGGIMQLNGYNGTLGDSYAIYHRLDYGQGGISTSNPLPWISLNGDSGSPLYVWNNETQSYQYFGGTYGGDAGNRYTIVASNTTFDKATVESYHEYVQMQGLGTVCLNAVTGVGETVTSGERSTTKRYGNVTDASGNVLTNTAGHAVEYNGLASGLNTWGDLSALKDTQNWYSYNQSYLIPSIEDLFFTEDLVFQSSGSENNIVLNATVDLGVGYAQFSKANGAEGVVRYDISSGGNGSYQFNHAGYVVDSGVEVHSTLTGNPNHMYEWRKIGGGDFYIEGSGNNHILLNVGGEGSTYLNRTNGYAAYNVLVNNGSTVVISDVNQIKRDLTFGNRGGTLDLNNQDMDWYLTAESPESNREGFSINALTEAALIANYTGSSTLTYKEGGNTRYLGSFADSATSSLKVVYDGNGRWELNSIRTNLQHADSGLLVNNGTVALSGTNTVHAYGSDLSTENDRYFNEDDWHYADATMNVTVHNSGTFELGSHARLTGDVTVEQGGTYVMREAVRHQLEYVEGGQRLEDTAQYSAYFGHKGNVQLNGGTFAVQFNDGVDANTSYAYNVTGTGTMTVDTGVLGASFTFSGAVDSGISKILNRGQLILEGAAAADTDNKWLVNAGGAMVQLENAQDTLLVIDSASKGTLALTQDCNTQLDMSSHAGLAVGAMSGRIVQYGAAGTGEALNTSTRLGGGGKLVVNYVLSGADTLNVDADGIAGGEVVLQQVATGYSGTVNVQSSGGRMTLSTAQNGAFDAATVNLNEGGVWKLTEGQSVGGVVNINNGGRLEAAAISGGKVSVNSGGMLSGADVALSGGSVELYGNMAYDTFTVTNGATLNLREGGRLDSTNAVTIAEGGIMRLNTLTLQDKVELKNGGIMYGSGGTIGATAEVQATEGTGKLSAGGGTFTVNGQIGAAVGSTLRLENGTFSIYTSEINSAGGVLELSSNTYLGHRTAYATQNIGGTLSVVENSTLHTEQGDPNRYQTITHNINHLHISNGKRLVITDSSSDWNHIYNISLLTGAGEIEWKGVNRWFDNTLTGPSRLVLNGDNSFEGILLVNQQDNHGSTQHVALAHDNAAKNMVINLWGDSDSRPGLAISTANANVAGIGGTTNTFVYAGAVKTSGNGNNPTSTALNTLTINTKGVDHTYNGTILGDATNGLNIVKTGEGSQTFTSSANVVHDVTALQGYLSFSGNTIVHGDITIAQGAQLSLKTDDSGGLGPGFWLRSGQTLNVIAGESGHSAVFSKALYADGGTINFGSYDSSTYALHFAEGFTTFEPILGVNNKSFSISFSNIGAIDIGTRYLLADGNWEWLASFVDVKPLEYLNTELNYSTSGLSVVFSAKSGYVYWDGDESSLGQQSQVLFGLTEKTSATLTQDTSLGGIYFVGSSFFTISSENDSTINTSYTEIGGSGTLVLNAKLYTDTLNAAQSNTLTGDGAIFVNDIEVNKGIQTTVEEISLTVENSIKGDGTLRMGRDSSLIMGSSVSGNVQLADGSTLVAADSSVSTNLTLGESGADSRVSLRMGNSSGVALNGSVAVQGNTTLSVQGSGALQFNSAFNKLTALELQTGVNLSLSSEISTHLVLDGGSASLSGNDNKILDGDVTVKNGGTLTFTGTGSDIIDYNKSGKTLTVAGGTIDFGSTRQTMGGWTLWLSDGAIVTGAGNATYGAMDYNDNNSTIYATSGSSTISAVTRLRNGNNLNYDVSEGATLTVSGLIHADGAAGKGSITKNGAGMLVLTAVNTYANTTTINGGTLSTSVVGALGSSSVVINDGGTLLLGGDNNKLLGEDITINAGGTLRFDGTGSDIINYDLNGKTLTVAGGTIDFGSTRQTMGKWALVLSDGATITGAGNATYGAIDFHVNNSTITATSGENTISAVTRVRDGGNLNYAVDDGATLTVSGLIHAAGFAKKASVTKLGDGLMIVSSNLNLNYLSTRAGEVLLTGTQNTVANVDCSMGSTAEGTLRLAQDSRLEVTGNIWSRNNTGILLDSGAELNISGKELTITNRAEEGTASLAATTSTDPGEYTINRTGYQISNAHVAYTGGDATINNKLTNSSIENAGSGILKVNNAENTLSAVYATGGSVKLFSAEELDLKALEVAASLSVSAYCDVREKVEEEARISVSEIASFGTGVTLNADLVMKSGATLNIAGPVQMGSDVRLETGLSLAGSQYDTLSSLKVGEKVTLFSGVDSLFLGDSSVASTAFTLDDRVLANEYFTNLSDLYFLVYDTTAGVGQGELSIAVVPEPTTATLSLLALAGLAARRRRK